MFLAGAADSPAARALYDSDQDDLGYVMNVSRLWAHQPALHDALVDLMAKTRDAASLSVKDRGILTTAAASTLGDSYCALAWGGKLAAASSAELASGVLTGDDGRLDERERAMAAWARTVSAHPNDVTTTDVETLRAAGFDDDEILAVTFYVALRLAYSVVNDALGARPDRELVDGLPTSVAEAVDWGRPPVT